MNKYYNPVKVINTNDWVKELKKILSFLIFSTQLLLHLKVIKRDWK